MNATNEQLRKIADTLEALAQALRRLTVDQDPPSPFPAGMLEEGDEVQRYLH